MVFSLENLEKLQQQRRNAQEKKDKKNAQNARIKAREDARNNQNALPVMNDPVISNSAMADYNRGEQLFMSPEEKSQITNARRNERLSRNNPTLGYPGRNAPPTVNYEMNAFGQKAQQLPSVPPSKPKQSASPTRLAALLAMAYPAINFASSNPNNSYPGADTTGGYGGAQQGLTSRDGPSRNPDVGERLSRFQMPTKEQFDLSLLDPRTRRDAAAVVRAKQKPMYGSK